MGWNSWDAFGSSVKEEQVLANADYMEKNLKSHGWNLITIDIQWYEPNSQKDQYRRGAVLEMDAHGRLLPAPNRFPMTKATRSFKPIADSLHAMHPALWGDFTWRITGKDAHGEVTMEGGWQNNRGGAVHRTIRFVENIFEELDAPGEWFLDKKTHTLYFYPARRPRLGQGDGGGHATTQPGRVSRQRGKAGALCDPARADLPTRRAHGDGHEGAAPAHRLGDLPRRGDFL